MAGLGGKLLAAGTMRCVAAAPSSLQGMPNSDACANGEGSDQDGDYLWRQRPTKPDHDERSGSSESGRYDAVGEVSGARRAQ